MGKIGWCFFFLFEKKHLTANSCQQIEAFISKSSQLNAIHRDLRLFTIHMPSNVCTFVTEEEEEEKNSIFLLGSRISFLNGVDKEKKIRN